MNTLSFGTDELVPDTSTSTTSEAARHVARRFRRVAERETAVTPKAATSPDTTLVPKPDILLLGQDEEDREEAKEESACR
mmetsp:Transcript_36547/g.66085  ORF Transcript_36547/g.66085 Transcript_36547/m.66085 type:complete len:80 (-) Transcript_36547:187-426(-)